MCSQAGGLVSALLSDCTTAGAPPDVSSPAHQSLNCRCGAIQSWSNIEIEHRLAGGLRRSRVVINHVTDLLLARRGLSHHEPIVSVKWRVGADKRVSQENNIGGDPYTDPNLDGYAQPNAWSICAFGVKSFGRPWNRMSRGVPASSVLPVIS